MPTINASEFKAKCLAILDRVARTGERVTILKRGRPVAQVVPCVPTTAERYPQHELAGTATAVGDIVAPVIPAEEWEAEDTR